MDGNISQSGESSKIISIIHSLNGLDLKDPDTALLVASILDSQKELLPLNHPARKEIENILQKVASIISDHDGEMSIKFLSIGNTDICTLGNGILVFQGDEDEKIYIPCSGSAKKCIDFLMKFPQGLPVNISQLSEVKKTCAELNNLLNEYGIFFGIEKNVFSISDTAFPEDNLKSQEIPSQNTERKELVQKPIYSDILMFGKNGEKHVKIEIFPLLISGHTKRIRILIGGIEKTTTPIVLEYFLSLFSQEGKKAGNYTLYTHIDSLLSGTKIEALRGSSQTLKLIFRSNDTKKIDTFFASKSGTVPHIDQFISESIYRSLSKFYIASRGEPISPEKSIEDILDTFTQEELLKLDEILSETIQEKNKKNSSSRKKITPAKSQKILPPLSPEETISGTIGEFQFTVLRPVQSGRFRNFIIQIREQEIELTQKECEILSLFSQNEHPTISSTQQFIKNKLVKKLHENGLEDFAKNFKRKREKKEKIIPKKIFEKFLIQNPINIQLGTFLIQSTVGEKQKQRTHYFVEIGNILVKFPEKEYLLFEKICNSEKSYYLERSESGTYIFLKKRLKTLGLGELIVFIEEKRGKRKRKRKAYSTGKKTLSPSSLTSEEALSGSIGEFQFHIVRPIQLGRHRKFIVQIQGTEIELSQKECEILSLFSQNERPTISSTQQFLKSKLVKKLNQAGLQDFAQHFVFREKKKTTQSTLKAPKKPQMETSQAIFQVPKKHVPRGPDRLSSGNLSTPSHTGASLTPENNEFSDFLQNQALKILLDTPNRFFSEKDLGITPENRVTFLSAKASAINNGYPIKCNEKQWGYFPAGARKTIPRPKKPIKANTKKAVTSPIGNKNQTRVVSIPPSSFGVSYERPELPKIDTSKVDFGILQTLLDHPGEFFSEENLGITPENKVTFLLGKASAVNNGLPIYFHNEKGWIYLSPEVFMGKSFLEAQIESPTETRETLKYYPEFEAIVFQGKIALGPDILGNIVEVSNGILRISGRKGDRKMVSLRNILTKSGLSVYIGVSMHGIRNQSRAIRFQKAKK